MRTVLSVADGHPWLRWRLNGMDVVRRPSMRGNLRRLIRQVGQPCPKVAPSQLSEVPDFLILQRPTLRDTVPVVGAGPATGRDGVHRHVNGVGRCARGRRLVPVSERFGGADGLPDVFLDPRLQLVPASAPGVIEGLLPERYVPEVVADALALEGDEGGIDVIEVASCGPIKRHQELAAATAATRAERGLRLKPEAVQISVAHRHRAADLDLLEVLPHVLGRCVGAWCTPLWRKRRQLLPAERQRTVAWRSIRPLVIVGREICLGHGHLLRGPGSDGSSWPRHKSSLQPASTSIRAARSIGSRTVRSSCWSSRSATCRHGAACCWKVAAVPHQLMPCRVSWKARWLARTSTGTSAS